MREHDLIIVEPWAIQGEKSGDAVWKYTAAQVDWLKRKGILKMEI
jgi:initiation factor 1A